MQVVYHTRLVYISAQVFIMPLDKRCTSCLKFKDFSEFGNDKRQQDEMKTMCKECRKDTNVRSFSTQLVVSPDRKICTKCLKPKKFPDDFNKMQKGEDGYHWYCRQCQSDYNIQFWRDNQEECIARGKAKQSKPEYKARRMERHRERSNFDIHYLNLRKQYRHQYYLSHKTQESENCGRYKARKLKATISKVNYAYILERDGWFCHICSKSIDPHAKRKSRQSLAFDHVIPLHPRVGEPQGSHSNENLKPSHHGCNVRKGNRPLEALTAFSRRGVE